MRPAQKQTVKAVLNVPMLVWNGHRCTPSRRVGTARSSGTNSTAETRSARQRTIPARAVALLALHEKPELVDQARIVPQREDELTRPRSSLSGPDVALIYDIPACPVQRRVDTR